MPFHKCRCMFIPPYVLDRMARSEREEVRKSALETVRQSTAVRLKRTDKEKEISKMLYATAPPGQGKRLVYDCQNKWELRVSLERKEGDPATSDDDVNKAYQYAGIVRDYLKKVLGRNSWDNNGKDIIANVHRGVNYNNAFWDGDEFAAGDGDGIIFIGLARSLDVVAHEFGHGIVQSTANLDYYSQSGALNEHFADVFGTVITQYAEKQDEKTADWLIGNEIMGPELYGEALRSMAAPGEAYDNTIMGKDPQPAHMDNYYSGPGDNRGVHINSGIPNKAFYLFAKERGTETAARIWYHALQNLWSKAYFNDAVEVIAESARTLIKAGKVTEGSPQTVRWAFRKVGLPM